MRRLGVLAGVLGGAGLAAYTVGMGVYALASQRPAVPSEPRTPEEARDILRRLGLADAYPFASHFAETPHGRMHYLDEGRGAPLLCLHGNPTWSFLYRSIVQGLSGTHRVVAPDLIGFGLSEKLDDPEAYSISGHVADVSALVEALDLRDVTLVVHDWGGPIGLGWALRHPSRVRALVVTNSLGFVPERSARGSGPPLALRVLRAPGLGEQLVQGLGLLHRLALGDLLQRPDGTLRAAYLGVHANWAARAGVLAFPRLQPWSARDPVAPLLEEEGRFLERFPGRVLVVWGMRDPFLDAEILSGWRRRLPGARIVTLEEAGHFVAEDAPEALLTALRDFLPNQP